MLLESSLFNMLKAYPNTHIIVAYSGGVDSQVLLHALSSCINNSINSAYTFKHSLSVCHVNHGLSKNAMHWEIFAQQECDLRNIPLDICRVKVQAKSQHSLEELARNARYDAIRQLIKNKKLKSALVLTGHHGDDQAETFLLALKRGSGLKGLSSMASVMPFDNAILARPLLEHSRNKIEAYAQKHKLNWINDESNSDVRFDRNFIRHHVMPVITERWPSFLKTMNRSAEHCQEAELLLAELAQQDVESVKLTDNSLSLLKLKSLSKPRFNNTIRYFLSRHHCLMPSTAQLLQLHSQLLSHDDKSPAVKVGDHWLRRFKTGVYLTPELMDVSDFTSTIKASAQALKNNTIELPDNLGKLEFSANLEQYSTDVIISKIITPQQEQQVTIRFSHNNPKCTPDYRQHSRSLKKVLQELNMPTWERKRLPFLYYNDELVAVIGAFVCKEFVPTKEDKVLNISWIK